MSVMYVVYMRFMVELDFGFVSVVRSMERIMEYVLWLLLKEEKGEGGFGGSHGGSEMVEDECDDNECCLFHGFGLAMILFMKPFYICFPFFSKAEHERL